MRIPAPINAPLRMNDLDSRITSPAWFEWFQRLSDYYEAIAKYLDPDNVLFGKIEPGNAQDGMLAYANGTDWDPGNGAGYYRKLGPSWEFASAITAVTYVDTAAFNDHSARHENAGADEISIAGLSGLLADGQTPLAHKTSHQNGGSDEISIAGLSGEAADEQKSKLAAGTIRGGVKIGDVFTVDGSEFLVLTVSATGGIEKSSSAIAIKVRASYGITVDADGIQLKKQAAEADDATPTATDLPTAIALANALQTKVNNMLAKLRSAEVIAT